MKTYSVYSLLLKEDVRQNLPCKIEKSMLHERFHNNDNLVPQDCQRPNVVTMMNFQVLDTGLITSLRQNLLYIKTR